MTSLNLIADEENEPAVGFIPQITQQAHAVRELSNGHAPGAC